MHVCTWLFDWDTSIEFEQVTGRLGVILNQGENSNVCMFVPGCLTVTHLLSLSRLLEGLV